MAKAKKIIFSIPEASIVKYATKEAFCEDAQGTVWCDDEFYFNYVSPIISWGEIYIIFVNSPQKGDFKLLLIRSENQSRQFYYYASGAQGSIKTSGDIINNKIPNDYYKYSFRWYKLKREINSYIDKLCKNKNIIIINNIECIYKAGRKHHYDFQVIINKNIIFNVEFKFNVEYVSETPQFVSPMKPSQYLEKSYEEYYYDNYLINIINEYGFLLPTKEEYLNKIHSTHP